MKRLILFLMALVMVAGCKVDTATVFEEAETLRLDLRAVVTDPEVQPLIPQGTLNKLALAESAFLTAKSVYERAGNDDRDALSGLADSAEDVIAILVTMEIGDGKYDKQISAIRLGIRILRNHL